MAVSDYVWGGIIAAGAVYETYALITKKPGDTLSETTRRLFRTGDPEVEGSGTRWGRLAFLVGWVGFSGWYLYHILWQVW